MAPSRYFTAAALVCGGLLSSASAQLVFNTGVGAGGSVLAPGSLDPHWTVVAGTGVTTPFSAVVVPEHKNWADPADAGWIWGRSPTDVTHTNPGGTQAANTRFTFRLTFDLTGYDPASAVLSGRWGADNFGSLFLNGAAAQGAGQLALVGDHPSTFNAAKAADRWFQIDRGFIAGLNFFDIEVFNAAGSSGNPAGLYVGGLTLFAEEDFAVTPPVPEPSSFAWAGVALLGLGVALRRWRKR